MSKGKLKKFYESPEWRRCKAAYLESVNHLCEVCLQKGIYTPAKIVHHKTHLTEDNYGDAEIMLSFDNLCAVCQACHNDIHGKAQTQRRWKFVDGELVIYDRPLGQDTL